MSENPRWEKCRVTCPEQEGEAELFLEWHRKDGKDVLHSSSCKNTKLMDLSGSDCEWTCWDMIEEKAIPDKPARGGQAGWSEA